MSKIYARVAETASEPTTQFILIEGLELASAPEALDITIKKVNQEQWLTADGWQPMAAKIRAKITNHANFLLIHLNQSVASRILYGSGIEVLIEALSLKLRLRWDKPLDLDLFLNKNCQEQPNKQVEPVVADRIVSPQEKPLPSVKITPERPNLSPKKLEDTDQHQIVETSDALTPGESVPRPVAGFEHKSKELSSNQPSGAKINGTLQSWTTATAGKTQPLRNITPLEEKIKTNDGSPRVEGQHSNKTHSIAAIGLTVLLGAGYFLLQEYAPEVNRRPLTINETARGTDRPLTVNRSNQPEQQTSVNQSNQATIGASNNEPDKPEHLGSFGQWGAYLVKRGNNKNCYALGEPRDRQPKSKLKDTPAFIFITTRPNDAIRDEVAIKLGYQTEDGSPATAEIDGSEWELITKGTTAWVKDQSKEWDFVNALRTGSRLVVKASTKRGIKTVDTYTLDGLSGALNRVKIECN